MTSQGQRTALRAMPPRTTSALSTRCRCGRANTASLSGRSPPTRDHMKSPRFRWQCHWSTLLVLSSPLMPWACKKASKTAADSSGRSGYSMDMKKPSRAVQDQSARSFRDDSAIQGCLLSISGSGFCPYSGDRGPHRNRPFQGPNRVRGPGMTRLAGVETRSPAALACFLTDRLYYKEGSWRRLGDGSSGRWPRSGCGSSGSS